MHLRLFVSALALAVVTLALAAPAAAEAPQINTPATISGTAAVGSQLTAHNGTWLYADGSACREECTMSYHWQRCADTCGDIGGATGRFYTVQAADAGHRLRVVETMMKNDCGEWNYSTGTRECRDISKSAASGQTAVVGGSAPSTPAAPSAPSVPAAPAPQAPLAPTATAAPAVTGLAMVDETLTASKGMWSGSPALALEWLRCDAAGENCSGMGVTSETYRVIPFDVGKTLRIKVSGMNGAGLRVALSDPTPVVSELKPTEAKPSLEASKVRAPHKLVISSLRARPAKLSRRSTVTLSLVVADSRGFRISGAVVKAVVLPTRAFALPAAATSAEDGGVTLVFTPRARVNLTKFKRFTFVVSALRPGDRPTSPRGSVVRVKLGVANAKTASRRSPRRA